MKDHSKNEAMLGLVIKAVKLLNKENEDNIESRKNAHLLAVQVLDDYAGDPDFDENDLDVLEILIQIFELSEDYPRLLKSLRHQARLLGWEPFILGERFFRALYASGEQAQFSDFNSLRMPGDSSEIGKTLMIACMPKSGSTFLHSALMEASGLPGPKLCLSYANEENMLSPEFVQSIYGVHKIAQEHVRAMPHNLAIMQAYHMDVVVLVRNIFDALVSARDMLLSDTKGNQMALFQADLPTMSDEQQLDAVISKWAHWQLDFYVSWVRALNEHRIAGKIITYEELMADKAVTIRNLLQTSGFEVDLEKAQGAVTTVEGDKDRSRLNVGTQGRGRQLMSDAQIESIQSMTRFYPGVDFSPLGLYKGL